jgi:serine protease Do
MISHSARNGFLQSTRILVAVLTAALSTSPVLRAEEPPAGQETLRSELRRLIGEARDRVFPALVSIRVVTVRFYGGRELKGQSVGSGAIISPQGYVVTNAHVVSGGKKFICTLSDKREVEARLVGEDPMTDLALLQLDLSALDDPAHLPVASFGDSDALEIGDYVMAMGSPYALVRSVSLGIVSNTERVFAGGFGRDDVEEMQLEQGQRTGLFTRWIQHDAVISPGNSGGPLVNLQGEIVGVNELGSGTLSFAIPSKLAAEVAVALIADGEVTRSWVGLDFKPIQRTGLDDGVLVDSVVVDGPAGRAGVEAGDVLLRLDGDPTTVRFVEEVPLLLSRIAGRPLGSTLELTLRRGDEVLTRAVTTEKLTKDLGEERSFSAWGLTAREITEKLARDWRLESRRGALVTGIRRGGPGQLAEPPLEEGDVLLSIDGEPLADLTDLAARYERLMRPDDEPGDLLVAFDRRGRNQVTLLEPRIDEADEPPRELPKAWIGVATQPLLPRLASELGLGDLSGFRVTRVYAGTEAEKAGLEVGDVVLALDGQTLRPRGLQDAALMNRAIRGLEIGDVATLDLARGDRRLEVPVPLERTRLSKEEARRHDDNDFEISVRELTFFDRDEQRWAPEVRGVLIENVDPGGWAGLGGLRAGDLVLRIDGEPVRSLRSFRQAMAEVKKQQPERVVVVILRGVRTHFQYLEPDWTPTEWD